MTIYIALLRGINVGGHHKMKMADLKGLLESMGLQKVKTYIQSGNVLFETEQDDSLSKCLEEEIEKRFGFPVPVVLRTSDEFKRVLKNCPYRMDELAENESVSVAFLADVPEQSGIGLLSAYRSEMDDFEIAGKDVYLFFKHSIRDSKLAANLSKLGTAATVRNWNTVKKLGELAKEVQD